MKYYTKVTLGFGTLGPKSVILPLNNKGSGGSEISQSFQQLEICEMRQNQRAQPQSAIT